MKTNTMRYVATTTIGKRLFIVIANKSTVKQGDKQGYNYGLTDDLNEATKTLNITSAKTLISDYLEHTGSTKSFGIRKVFTTFELEEEIDDGRESNTD
jgi:hypothetical protein